jgi:type I restriction enzyme S subunit
MFLSSEELQDYFINASTSSGGQANISPDLIRNIKIIIPDEKTLQDFNKIIQPIFKQISINCFQSQTLSSLRDTLLPKLMSGEVRVK